MGCQTPKKKQQEEEESLQVEAKFLQ